MYLCSYNIYNKVARLLIISLRNLDLVVQIVLLKSIENNLKNIAINIIHSHIKAIIKK
jgi:hypothetical protein